MTYLQLMIKCLKFFHSQNEKFDSYEFYYHWLGNDEENIDLYYKSRVKKAVLYLILSETKKIGSIDNSLMTLLERELSYFDISLCKIIEKIEEKTIESISQDPYMLDQICMLELGELIDEEQKDIIKESLEELKKQTTTDFEMQQYESAIHNIMEMVSQIIPELFFTEKGYQHIDKEFQIDDPEFRRYCYEYLKENIKYYNSNRIYKVDENIYSQLYESQEEPEELDDYDDELDYDEEENLGQENLYLDDDEIRDQVDIYGEDIDNYDILYYSITLLVVMLRFIKNKQYDKLNRMIEIDDIMTNSYNGYSFNCDKTLIEALYQPKTMGQDYHREIFTSSKSDFYLDFFLSNNQFTQQYNIKQLSLIISYCFDLFDSEPINKIIRNIDAINNAFENTRLDNQEENIKRLVRIKKGTSNL